MLTYQEVVTTKLGSLTAAAVKWDEMAEAFKKVEALYKSKVLSVADDGGWIGISAEAAYARFKATQGQLAAAQTQAKAIASLLRDAHTQFTTLIKAVKDLVVDAKKKHFLIDSQGRATYDWSQLDESAKKDTDYDDFCRRIGEAETAWTHAIKKAVQHVDDADESVKLALRAAAGIDATDDLLLGGHDFNARAVGDIEFYEARQTKDDATATETDGWKSEGKASASGPDVGLTVSGTKYGKESSVKAYADLGHATAEGSLTNGPWKLSGIGDAYAGARATANWGFTEAGLTGKAEVSAGGRGLAEGRAEYGHLGVYGRTEGFAGGEAAVSAGAGLEGVNAGAKAFAGGKVSAAGGGEVAGIGGGGTVEGWAGAGAEAKVTFGKEDDGKFHIGGKVGVGLGLGGSVGAEFTIDPGKVSDAASDAADFVGDTADSVGDAAGSVKDGVVGLFD
uniref:PPE domain-containing protein n=1 Tax=Streptomyces antimycoticus TaxID=68175 RepID=UPI002F90DC67|nr:hypothetical protein OG546_49440 [Streptomyces antimycoticus]